MITRRSALFAASVAAFDLYSGDRVRAEDAPPFAGYTEFRGEDIYIGDPTGPSRWSGPIATPGQSSYRYLLDIVSQHLVIWEDDRKWSGWRPVADGPYPGLEFRDWRSPDGPNMIVCVDIRNVSSDSYAIYMYGRDYNGAMRTYNVLQSYLWNGRLASRNYVNPSEAGTNYRAKRPLLFSPGGRMQCESRQGSDGLVSVTIKKL